MNAESAVAGLSQLDAVELDALLQAPAELARALRRVGFRVAPEVAETALASDAVFAAVPGPGPEAGPLPNQLGRHRRRRYRQKRRLNMRGRLVRAASPAWTSYAGSAS